jgi:hypothetical protein
LRHLCPQAGRPAATSRSIPRGPLAAATLIGKTANSAIAV